VKRDIASFLSGSTAVQARYPSDEKGPAALRPRDFWGLVLARLTGRPLQINVSDGPMDRDEEISCLLQEVRDR
jgi:hypothetical protein